MQQEEPSSFQFILCLIWNSNFWVKIGLALKRSKMSFPPLEKNEYTDVHCNSIE